MADDSPQEANPPPKEPPLPPLALEWLPFTKAVESKLVPQPDDRPLDQYLEFRNAVLRLVQKEEFLNALTKEWNSEFHHSNSPENQDALNALVMELKAFPRAQDVFHTTGKPEESKEGWRKLLERASVTIKSVKEMLDKLPWWAKNSLTLFKELVDIFKAKG
jgi:hypothetical protein